MHKDTGEKLKVVELQEWLKCQNACQKTSYACWAGGKLRFDSYLHRVTVEDHRLQKGNIHSFSWS